MCIQSLPVKPEVKICWVQNSGFELDTSIKRLKLGKRTELDGKSVSILCCLASHYNHKTRPYVFPSQEEISEQTCYSIDSVKQAIKTLKDKGLIIVVKTMRGNRYYFTNVFFDLMSLYYEEVANSANRKEDYSTCESSKLKLACITDKRTDKNNKSDFKITNTNKQHWKNKPLDGIHYKSAETTIHKIKQDRRTSISPLELPKSQQILFYNNLPEFAKNGIFAREIKRRWSL